MKTYIGIDIGLKGAIAVMSPEGIITTSPMPVVKDQLDLQGLKDIMDLTIINQSSKDASVVFEKLGVIFGTSKATAFSMGLQLGAMEMLCVSQMVPYTKVPAKQWQKDMFMGVDEIKNTKGKRDTKAMALVAVKRLFPNLKLTFGERATKPHDGLVDAVLMAEWARRNNL
jgi:hypothetical protein